VQAEQKEVSESDFLQEDLQQAVVKNSASQRQITDQIEAEDSFAFSVSNERNVQIRVEPFAPVVVGPANDGSLFDGQVYLLRHVQIADQHFIQGFQLNEEKLLSEISDSAKRFMRRGMDFCLDKNERDDSAHSAFLDFGFGTVVLNLLETNPGWSDRQIKTLQKWYFAIITIVVLAMLIVIASLWRNMRAQVKLTQKKDDFISAVSHELRTPLTSIRMYSEMLEKNWVKSPEKTQQYYKNMRQESERLSRLIENVLDFSRIQKGRKKYAFNLGDLNECVSDVVNMMGSYAAKADFIIETQLNELKPIVFDKDAVTQIVVNLLDNAVKYAGQSKDKTLVVRTKQQAGYVLIEVEDHGPGIAHTQKKKVFDVFYRCGSESTRQTKGTGLGLALVKRFTEAHDGFVEILNAKPHGAIFRVAISSNLQA
jgi:signal transduction histidine kinase